MYKTADLNLAATLAAMGHRVEIGPSDGRRREFWFHDSDELEDDIEKYWEGVLSLNPREVLESLKGLKSRMYNSYERED